MTEYANTIKIRQIRKICMLLYDPPAISLRTRIGFCERCASMCSMQRKIDEESPPVFRMQSWKSKLKGGTETEGG
jgi:hypothetical protein